MNNFAQQPGHQKTLPQQRAKMGHLSVIITQVQHEIDTKEINKTKNIHHIISTIACNNMNNGHETSTQYLQRYASFTTIFAHNNSIDAIRQFNANTSGRLQYR